MKVSAAQWLFALKLYLSIMLAFMLSSKMGLEQTYWTVVTCCVVMNPLSGAMRSKSVYRFVGTLCAGIVSLALAACLAHTPILMLAGVGLVGSIAFGASLLDRTPKSYGVLLFGITLMIITVPAVNQPDTLFDTMVTRLCEIGIAIICCTIVDSVLFPRSLGPTIRSKLDQWLADMEIWLDEALEGRQTDDDATRDRFTALADIGNLSVLASQLRYDPIVTRHERRTAFCIQVRLLRMTPLLYAISERVADAEPAVREKLRAPLLKAARLAHQGKAADEDLESQILAIDVPDGPSAAWRKLVLENLSEMATTTLKFWAEIQVLRKSLHTHEPLPPELEAEVNRTRMFPLKPDLYMANRLFWGCLLAFTLLTGFWGLTGWSMGWMAVFQGVVTIAVTGSSDNQDRAILETSKIIFLGLVSGAVMSYGLLPMARDLPSFALIMALFILPLGAWMFKRPLAMLVIVIGFSSINFQSLYTPYDFGFYLESSFANMLGVYTSLICVLLVRPMGSLHALERLKRQGRKEILDLTFHATPRERDIYINRSLNRIGLAVGRDPKAGYMSQSRHIMRAMRTGVCIAELRSNLQSHHDEIKRAFEAMLVTLREEIFTDNLSGKLLMQIDQTLSAAWREGTHSARDPFLRGLISLRLILFEFAESWRPKQ